MPDNTTLPRPALARAVARGSKNGRPVRVTDAQIVATLALGATAGAKALGMSRTQWQRRRLMLEDAARVSRPPIKRDTAKRLAAWLMIMHNRAAGPAVGELALLRDALLAAVRDGLVVIHVGP